MLSFVWCILFYELETLEKDDSFLKIILFICLLAMLSLCCCTGFPHCSDGKESTCNAGDLGLIPGLGRSPGERHGSDIKKKEKYHMIFLIRGI